MGLVPYISWITGDECCSKVKGEESKVIYGE